jgi:hypothetical protein
MFSIYELEEDIKYLLARAGQAGSCHFSDEGRDVGMSSNSLVSIAYHEILIVDQVLPLDQGDLDACQLAFDRLPAHRKNQSALMALECAKFAISNQKNDHHKTVPR